jgi:hypothetical protein
MSEYAEKVRKDRSEKVKRYLRKDPQGKIDASEYTPPDELMADVKTGMRPISKRQFKKGGKVVGDKGKHHAGRKKRAEGGPLDMDNRDLKAENKKRDGEKHVGGFKDGGRPKRAAGGPMMAGAAPMGPQAPINVPTQAIGGFAPSSKGLMAQAGMTALKRGGRTHKSHGGELSPASQMADMTRNGYAADWSGGAGAPAPAPAPSRAPAPQRRAAPMPPPTPPSRSVASQDQMQTGRGLPANYGQTGRGLPAGGGPTFSQPPQTFSGSDMASVGKSDLPPPRPSNNIGPQIGASGTSDVPPPDPNDMLNGKAAGWYNRGGKVRNPGNDRITGTAPTGGRLAKADGGRTKKGAVNIVIAVGGHKPEGGAGGPPGPMGPPLAHPPIPPQPVGGAAVGVAPNGGMPMPGGAPPMQMPPPNMGRKHGGSVKHAAGGGEGRLDKIRKYGKGV